MADTPHFYVNSPVSGTRYYVTEAYACIPNSSTTQTVTVKAWSGANGTGSLVQVTTLTCWTHDDQANNSPATNSGNFNTVSASYSGAQNNGSDWFRASGQWSGTQSVGSLEMWITYTGQAVFPTTPTFSPSNGGVGTSVTLTGTRFTSCTNVNLNGVAASFTIVNDTTITATVPSGATSGVWTVSNIQGSSSSASNFLVANGYVYRSGVWTAAPVEVYRSGAMGVAQGVFVYRSGVWTSTQ